MGQWMVDRSYWELEIRSRTIKEVAALFEMISVKSKPMTAAGEDIIAELDADQTSFYRSEWCKVLAFSRCFITFRRIGLRRVFSKSHVEFEVVVDVMYDTCVLRTSFSKLKFIKNYLQEKLIYSKTGTLKIYKFTQDTVA